MIRIEGINVTIGDDLFGSGYCVGHSDFDIALHSGETVHIPFRVLRFALSVLATTHECGSFDDLWRVLGGEREFIWHKHEVSPSVVSQDDRAVLGRYARETRFTLSDLKELCRLPRDQWDRLLEIAGPSRAPLKAYVDLLCDTEESVPSEAQTKREIEEEVEAF